VIVHMLFLLLSLHLVCFGFGSFCFSVNRSSARGLRTLAFHAADSLWYGSTCGNPVFLESAVIYSVHLQVQRAKFPMAPRCTSWQQTSRICGA
jgi:hypothetical protein